MTDDTSRLDQYFAYDGIPLHISASDLQSIRDWLNKQPHLPYVSDRQILIFLHSCFCAVELTKKTIDTYYTIRTHASELFDGRTADEVGNSLKVIYGGFLPRQLPDESLAFLFGLKDNEPNKFSVSRSLRFGIAMMDIYANENPYSSGWRVIFDMTGFTFNHLAKVTASIGLIKKTVCYVEDGLPIRLKGIHVFNAVPLIHQLLALVKPIMKKELFDLIHIHTVSDPKSLYEIIPLEYLPSNYGGKGASVDDLIKISKEKMLKYEGWFLEDDKFNRVNEKRRIGKPKNSNDIFGIEGSFKKLDFD